MGIEIIKTILEVYLLAVITLLIIVGTIRIIQVNENLINLIKKLIKGNKSIYR